MFQDHQTISALSCFFDAAKVLRKTRQNNPFPTTSPKNSCFWEKSGISWEKVRRKRKRKLKSKENQKITPLFPPKSLIFSQRWEKSWESWEKCLIKIKKAPPSPSMKKMLLTKATKVTQIFYLQSGNNNATQRRASIKCLLLPQWFIFPTRRKTKGCLIYFWKRSKKFVHLIKHIVVR